MASAVDAGHHPVGVLVVAEVEGEARRRIDAVGAARPVANRLDPHPRLEAGEGRWAEQGLVAQVRLAILPGGGRIPDVLRQRGGDRRFERQRPRSGDQHRVVLAGHRHVVVQRVEPDALDQAGRVRAEGGEARPAREGEGGRVGPRRRHQHDRVGVGHVRGDAAPVDHHDAVRAARRLHVDGVGRRARTGQVGLGLDRAARRADEGRRRAVQLHRAGRALGDVDQARVGEGHRRIDDVQHRRSAVGAHHQRAGVVDRVRSASRGRVAELEHRRAEGVDRAPLVAQAVGRRGVAEAEDVGPGGVPHAASAHRHGRRWRRCLGRGDLGEVDPCRSACRCR